MDALFLCVVLPCRAEISASAGLSPTKIRVSGPPKYPWLTVRAKLTRYAGLSGRTWIWARLLLEGRSDICGYLGIDQPSWRALSNLWIKISCLTRCMGTRIGCWKIKETNFAVSTRHSDYPLGPLLILGKFGEAAKKWIYSNNQTCHLCNVGSILYSISCTPETYRFELGLCCDAIEFGKKSQTFQTLKIQA